MGSIRPYRTKRGEQRYYIVYDGPIPVTGKRHQIKRMGFKTQRDARAALVKGEHETQQGHTPVKGRGAWTVEDAVNEWTEQQQNRHKLGKITLSTLIGRRASGQQIIRRLGHVQLRQLRPQQIEQVYLAAIQEGLAVSTVRGWAAFLRQILRLAVGRKLTTHNPAAEAETPAGPKQERPTLTVEESLRLLEAADRWKEEQGSPWRLPILLALTTGLRRGEVCGLRWQDCDLQTGIITVRVQVVQVSGQKSLQPPKTRKTRIVKLPPFLVAELQERRRLYPTGEQVFLNQDGSLLSPANMSIAFRRISEGIGLSLHLHDLRHTHASILFSLGVDIEVIRRRLGHDTLEITRHYTHLFSDAQDAAAARLETALRPGK